MTDLDIAELVAARVCHDLISPVGAIGNGLELIMGEPVVARDDLELVETSARAAEAVLKFHRIAFGSPGDGSTLLSLTALRRIAEGYFVERRIALDWPGGEMDVPRPVAKAILLTLLTGASAAPYGATMRLDAPRLQPLLLRLSLEGRRVGLGADAMALLERGEAVAPIRPRDAHFVLLSHLVRQLGTTMTTSQPQALDDKAARLTLEISAGR